MGLLTDYFAATPEQAAACRLEGPSDEELPVASLKLVDPSVLLGKLWAGVAGQPFGPEYYADDGLVGEPLADGPWLVKIKPVCRAVLAGISDEEQVRQAAAGWAEAAEWFGAAEPEELVETILKLRQVALAAGERGQRLYAWVCQ